MHLLSVLVSFTLAVRMLTQCNLNCSLSVICMCLCQHWHFYFIAMVTAFIFVWQGKLGHYTSGIAGATTGPLNWAAILPCQTSAFLFFFFFNHLFDFVVHKKCHSRLCVVSSLGHDFRAILCTVGGALYGVFLSLQFSQLLQAQWVNHSWRYLEFENLLHWEKVSSDWRL